MNEESKRFRMRAQRCRDLAKFARDKYQHDDLTQMAKELEAKARAAEAIVSKLGGAYQSSGKAES